MSTTNEELVPVQVPRSMLTAVYAVLADQSAETDDDWGEWDWVEDDFRALLSDTHLSTQRMISTLDYLSDHPDTPIALVDLANGAGLTVSELKGALSGFTRVLNGLWGSAEWPMEVTWGAAKAKGQVGEAHYTMRRVLAERYKKARK